MKLPMSIHDDKQQAAIHMYGAARKLRRAALRLRVLKDPRAPMAIAQADALPSVAHDLKAELEAQGVSAGLPPEESSDPSPDDSHHSS